MMKYYIAMFYVHTQYYNVNYVCLVYISHLHTMLIHYLVKYSHKMITPEEVSENNSSYSHIDRQLQVCCRRNKVERCYIHTVGADTFLSLVVHLEQCCKSMSRTCLMIILDFYEFCINVMIHLYLSFPQSILKAMSTKK